MEEREMLQPIATTFIPNGYRIYYEVPLLTKIMDIFGVSTDTSDRIAIECKVKDWKRGLQQAKNYLMCAEHVFLAIHENYVHRALKYEECFTNLGIGLLSVNGKAEIVIEPKVSSFINGKIAEKVLSSIANRPEKEVQIGGE